MQNYRRETDVPLVVPIVNPEHLDIIENKVKNRKLRKENWLSYLYFQLFHSRFGRSIETISGKVWPN